MFFCFHCFFYYLIILQHKIVTISFFFIEITSFSLSGKFTCTIYLNIYIFLLLILIFFQKKCTTYLVAVINFTIITIKILQEILQLYLYILIIIILNIIIFKISFLCFYRYVYKYFYVYLKYIKLQLI